MSQLITLMYHSIYSTDEEWQQIKPEDQPYALHIDTFKLHLDYLMSGDFNIIHPEQFKSLASNEKKSILITFDDGHIGFFKYAFPALLQRKLSAIFFITPDLINQPKPSEYCSWSQLKEMSDAGMSIQSHGQSHDFFADMSNEKSNNEFLESKSNIEKNTHNNVWGISFPGGRYQQKNIKQGRQLGYSHFFTSDFGIDSTVSLIKGGIYFRHAIRVNTDLNRFKKIVNISAIDFYKSKIIYLIKKGLKLIIGNNNYHRLYKRIK